MTTYAIGDIQGCYPELNKLLERLAFDPAHDQLIFCGDLVNRGDESLEVMRLLHSLGDRVIVTLGNHDLSLLAVSLRDEEAQARVNPDLRRILFAEDRETLLSWLRGQPLLHHDVELEFTVIHAGLAPSWTLKQAQRCAHEVERELRSNGHVRMLQRLFGDRPAAWSPKLHGLDRLRANINVLTRMRYCDIRGRIAFAEKGQPGTQRPGLYPWFAVPGMVRRNSRLVCGHWSALGRFAGLGVYALDTGCVWGGQLTALRIERDDTEFIAVNAEPHRKRR